VNVQVIAHDTRLSSGLRKFIEERIHFALRRYADRIGQVAVHVEDINGPKGGVDQRCRIDMTLVPWGAVHGQATDENLPAALGRAIERVIRQFHRTVERRRDRRLRAVVHRPAAVAV